MDAIQRAIEAKALLENDLFKECLDICKREIVAKWERTSGAESSEREWLWKMHIAAASFEAALRGVIDTGRMAQEALKNKERPTLGQKIRSIM